MGRFEKLKERLGKADRALKEGNVKRAQKELKGAEKNADCGACKKLVHNFRGQLGSMDCHGDYCPVDEATIRKMKLIETFADPAQELHERFEDIDRMKPRRLREREE
jgi:hypothetical protein